MFLHKHSLLSLYKVTHMDLFKAGHLVLDNKLVCPSWGKTLSPMLSIAWLCVVLCVGLQLCGLSPIH